MSKPKLHDSWLKVISQEFTKGYMLALKEKLTQAKQNTTVYPKGSDIFKALNSTPLDIVKVVILGQDPYHNPNQANGLCFSVHQGIEAPPSLKNIFKEINDDLNILRNQTDLTDWAKQGVLLLNTWLTVERGKPQSHHNFGWETFTDRIIKAVDENCNHVVFLLWGAHAQKKQHLINTKKHSVLKAPHPSPLSAHRGFFGCKHFSQTNTLLEKHHQTPIKW